MEPSQDDGLKWFGEGFDGFPKRLPEDCVEYVIHVIDDKLQDIAATRARLNAVLKAANLFNKDLLKDYIWQRDPFLLKLHPSALDGQSSTGEKPTKDESGQSHLRGRTYFGDSIADEWLIVYLLLELSKQFPEIWIRVYDTDGEFLLIEAAGVLPKWLNPDVAENRVWINNGHMRLIPLQEGTPPQNLTSSDALEFIRSKPQDLIISPYVEDEAFHRVREYPDAIASSLHNALTTLPRKLAYVLHHNPAYISPAIEAFYLRDPISLKPLTTKDLSTLQFPPEDLVTASVRFTRVGYAQLRGQVFEAPPAWTGILPKLKDSKVEMGMKLTCGFEMMITDPQLQDKRVVREVKLLLEDLESGDDSLPDDKAISTWSQKQDDEKWLDIDYNDFEAELSGRKKGEKKEEDSTGGGFGDASAQNNLRKMVSRFEDFLKDDEAGIDGVDDVDSDDEDDEDDSSEPSSAGEDKDGSFDEAEFERAMKEMMGMPGDEIEKSGLLAEARRLAVEDAEQGGEMNIDEEEEVKKMMEMMEKELKSHGALNLDAKAPKGPSSSKQTAKKPVYYGPERPPNLLVDEDEASEESADEDIGPGDVELSSDEDGDEYNDVDLGLAKNMLEAFKGQAGLSGPAGNLMRQMGINMPRDEGEDGD